MSKRAVPKPPFVAASSSPAEAVPGTTSERRLRDRLPQALPILPDEAAAIDRFFGEELSKLFGDQ